MFENGENYLNTTKFCITTKMIMVWIPWRERSIAHTYQGESTKKGRGDWCSGMLVEEDRRNKIKKSRSAIEMFKLCSTERTTETDDGSYCTDDTSQIDASEKKWSTLHPFTEIIYRASGSNLYHSLPIRNLSGSTSWGRTYANVLTELFIDGVGSNSGLES
jgi:hypothetical protein